MEVYRRSSWLLLLLGVTFLAAALQGVQGEAESEGPSESECRPYIEKALKELATEDNADHPEAPGTQDSMEDIPTVEITTDDSDHQDSDGDDDTQHEGKESTENLEHTEDSEQTTTNSEETTDKSKEDDQENEDDADVSKEYTGEESVEDAHDETKSEEEEEIKSVEDDTTEVSNEEPAESKEEIKSVENEPASVEDTDKDEKSAERSIEDEAKSEEQQEETQSTEDVKSAEGEQHSAENKENSEEQAEKSTDEEKEVQSADEEDVKSTEEETKSIEEEIKSIEEETKSAEDEAKSTEYEAKSEEDEEKASEVEDKTTEVDTSGPEGDTVSDEKSEEKTEGDEKQDSGEDTDKSVEQTDEGKSVEEDNKSGEKDITEEAASTEAASAETTEKDTSGEEEREKRETADTITTGAAESVEESETASEEKGPKETEEDETEGSKEEASTEKEQSDEPVPEEELTNEIDIPTDLRPRDHIDQLLKLDEESSETEKIINRIADITLRDLKRVYENAIKPLEVLYKYRDLSNRHFGDSEIFSKPLVLFMGPWSGGKSSIINYLVDNEYSETSLRTGAEPSPAYFNILMYGDEPEVLDGTQLAADFTFSGLQKFGQGLEERLRGLKLPRKLLEKINLVEIPGILEVRKQVSRVFPFNDACQWFIDRADIIFLVYDPSKLDVGPETEAILDQLKGREHQTRIILNKADQVKPEELMRVQGALIWNISPLMSSAQPPVMYTTTLWTRPYEVWAPVRLLQAQERAFLRDLRSAIDKRIDNKISSARRFAVRVRNHAKMVDCYLTTYYNHKSVFGNKKQVADEIIEHPQDYHIYEGISTLTNISRYDLPDPDVYRDFFKLNPLYDFQQLSATCTYFRGCPINRLDVAIAYDLPELIGKHKRLVESALTEANLSQTPGS